MQLFTASILMYTESGQLPAESGQRPAESEQLPFESGQLHVPIESGQLPAGSEQFKEDISHRTKKKLTVAGELLFEDTVNKHWAVLSKIKRKLLIKYSISWNL